MVALQECLDRIEQERRELVDQHQVIAEHFQEVWVSLAWSKEGTRQKAVAWR